ncbi:hypothetical protein A33M_0306 [Rhodovulum sp. PH10]|uniref:hypothetical protein n=1 Tax=Rhodovulum sp. PH10 TaxID=1187851 RepID=UPI00027C2162|nr:hypothetical protein [Rhodovulum sp. PH10]EJW13147.1 hypothetical protein A33M_0306 [Rhodovulum sp. PH10]
MATLGSQTFVGQSGTEYEFLLFQRDTEFKQAGAVYVVTIRYPSPSGGFSFRNVFIGETRDLSERQLNHRRTGCFDAVGANHVFVCLEGKEDRREAIKADLLAAYETPCNANGDGVCVYPNNGCPRVWPWGQ